MQISNIAETSLYTSDIEAARKFYGEILGLEEMSYEPNYRVFYKIGEIWLLIFNPAQTNQINVVLGNPIPTHGTSGSSHLALQISIDDYSAWEERLDKHNVVIELNANWVGGRRSMFFRDNEGNLLELNTGDVLTEFHKIIPSCDR